MLRADPYLFGGGEGLRKKIPFVPSPHDVVKKMLSIADPKPDELLIDLGSGDGRIVISAARDYGCRSLGVEIDDMLIDHSRRRIQRLGLKNAEIVKADLHQFDLSDADIVTLYLLPETLKVLKPRLLNLKRGARIVSHDYRIPGLEPDEVYIVRSGKTGRDHLIYLYEID